MPALARRLTLYAGQGQIVQDRTGLKGSYDFTLKWLFGPPSGGSSADGSGGQPVPSAPEPAGTPDLFTAMQKQLGLKLESTKGPVQIVVIDHVERPSAN